MTEDVVTIAGLEKSFGRTRALDGLDLAVARGEVHGLVGPNGSGKTTTLRVLLGLLRADTGRVVVLGADPWRDAVSVHRRLAYVPADVVLWPNLTGGEIVDLLGRLRGGADPRRRAELCERFDLDPTRRARSYSSGNRRKVALVAALAAPPSRVGLLLLDEPTAGLDPLMDAEFRRCLAEERAAGRTVLLSSHALDEVEAVCDRVSIVRAGRTVETGSMSDLRRRARTEIVAEFAGLPPDLGLIDGVEDLHRRGNRLSCTVEQGALAPVLAVLAARDVRSLVSRPPSLEEVFLRHWADRPGDAGTPSVETVGAP